VAKAKDKSPRKSGSGGSKPAGIGEYMVINGKRIELVHHKTDFQIQGSENDLRASGELESLQTESASPNVTRVRAGTASERDNAIDAVRERNLVAHHVYESSETGEELLIDDHVLLRLRNNDDAELRAIMDEFSLLYSDRMGGTHVLQVTNATGMNPIKVANLIAERDGVEYCSPQVLMELHRHDSLNERLQLFRDQWYLSAELSDNPDVDANADIRAPQAWMITRGSPDIVVAVLDDGYDLGHPAFSNNVIHPQGRDFASATSDANPSAGPGDFHGTPVASIAIGNGGSAMTGVAPDCTFLPLRIAFGPAGSQLRTLHAFRHASRHADVLNCSFGLSPLSFDALDPGFRDEIAEMARTGGRRGKGLVIVFSAGNDDAPTHLSAAENVNGVRFLGFDQNNNPVVRGVPAHNEVFSGYPTTEGLVVVASMSSRRRKSGYSNWGRHISVTAPSSNGHELGSLLMDFSAAYRGLGQIAAVNRPNHGRQSRPLRDDPTTPNVRENFYTDDFGGTSGAAPVVAGVAALVLSVNPDLTAAEVRQLLMATADENVDVIPDLIGDPNLQNALGDFVNGRSPYFGAGKVDALAAVQRAAALAGPGQTGTSSGSNTTPQHIPDSSRNGVVSGITLTNPGSVRAIEVSVDITHTYRGDLAITLTSPDGFTALLKSVDIGDSTANVHKSFTHLDTPSLNALLGVRGEGEWRLHVADRLQRDVGTLVEWSIRLDGA